MREHEEQPRVFPLRPARDPAAELAAMEQRYDALVRAVGAWSWQTDATGQAPRITFVRPDAAGGWALPLVGETWDDLIHPDDRATVRAAWERSLAGHLPLSVVGRMRRADGDYRTMQLLGAPVYDDAGKVREWVGVARDITDARRVRAEAQAHAAQLEATIEAMADPVVICDGEGRLLHANAAFRALLHTPVDPEYEQRPLAERMRLVDIRTPEGEPLAPELWPLARVLRGETIAAESTRDFLVRALDGSEVLLSPTGAPVRDATGAITGGVAIYRDVTERRRLERRTHEALAALLAMAEALVTAPDPVTERAVTGATPEASEAARRLAELTADVLACRYVSILTVVPSLTAVPPPHELEEITIRGVAVAGLTAEQTQRWWARYAEGVSLALVAGPEQVGRLLAGDVFVSRVRTPEYSGAVYGVQTVLWVPLRIGEQLVGVLAADYGAAREPDEAERALAGACGKLVALVVERERLLRERAEAQAAALVLREANRRLDEFLSIASHELRTPLTTIKANLQIAQRRAHGMADEARARRLDNAPAIESLLTLLARTSGAIERQNHLVDDLLDVSRIHAGRLQLRAESLDLAAVVADAVEEQRLAHPGREITLTRPEHAVDVVADGERIRQVVANYLTNALKYSAANQPVAVRLDEPEGMVRISVRDRGVGIPLEEQQLIWERFHRVPGVGHVTGSGIGLGLGLFISREIVERHGGTVGLESAPGAGSTFWFALPRGAR